MKKFILLLVLLCVSCVQQTDKPVEWSNLLCKKETCCYPYYKNLHFNNVKICITTDAKKNAVIYFKIFED